MTSRTWFVACASVAVLFGAGDPVRAQVERLEPVTDAMLQDPDPSDWLNWRRTLDGWGYSPLDQINLDNVGELRLAWSWGMEPGVSQTTPIVHDGILYLANPGNVVQALRADSGDFIWEYRREMEERLRPAAQMRSLAIYEDLIILNTVDAHVVGLDARTGEERWDTDVTPDQDGYGFSSGPIIADGTVVAGLRGCERFREDTCYIVGVHGRTGRLLWRTSTIARPGERGGDTWGDLPLLFRAGSDAWIPGAYDPLNRLVYYGTSQAKPWSRDARGTDGDALYSNSTLALDPETGEMRWFFQHIPGDSHDMDETFERILIDYDGRQSVFSMGKLGILWELDRTTGAFTKAVDLGYQNLAYVDPETGAFSYRDGMVSGVGEELFFCPSTGGFKALRAMAYHPDTTALYVPLNLNCETAAFGMVERRAGGGGTGGVRGRLNHFHPDAPGQLGEFQALDIRTGETLWKHRRRAPYNTAALTTAGGLVFVGDWERHVFAYDAATGEQLWQSRLTTMSNGYPITYAVDGKQYIAFSAGGPLGASSWTNILPSDLLQDIRNPRQGGNALFAFTLPLDPPSSSARRDLNSDSEYVTQELLKLENMGMVPRLDRSTSVAGPDINDDGVRDDIEAYVGSLFDTAAEKNALLQVSRVLRMAMIVGEGNPNSEELRRTSNAIGDAINCVWTTYSDDIANEKVADIRKVTVNTQERFAAYGRYSGMVSGFSLRLPAENTCAAP